MINFIIYEDEKKYREMYISIILKLVGGMSNAYKITEIEKYDKTTMSKISKLTGKKIFILDIEVPGKSGLDLAREIRDSGDWNSPMIIATTHEQMRIPALTSKMLMLDFIYKYFDLDDSLKEALKISLGIIENHKSLNFQYNGELYQIPYNDILYIEKNVDDSYSTIVTRESSIKIKRMIGVLEKELSVDPRFYRTHRSCIVNTDNITRLELKDSIIYFGDKETTLLSRDKKAGLKEILSKDIVVLEKKDRV